MSEHTQETPAILTSGIAKFTATPSPAAVQRKSELLELASLVLSVASEEEQADAIDAASQIKAVEQGIEASRKLVKAPILEAGKDVDEAARKFVADLTKERLRIEGLLTNFALEQRRKFEAEQARLRAEAEAAAEAERQRLQDIADAEHAEASALAAALEEPAPAAPAPVAAPAPMIVYTGPLEAPRMDGASFKEEYDFEVTDIHALYAWNRLFVKLEVDRANFKAFLNMTGKDPGQIPGVRVFSAAKATVRAVKSRAPRLIE